MKKRALVFMMVFVMLFVTSAPIIAQYTNDHDNIRYNFENEYIQVQVYAPGAILAVAQSESELDRYDILNLLSTYAPDLNIGMMGSSGLAGSAEVVSPDLFRAAQAMDDFARSLWCCSNPLLEGVTIRITTPMGQTVYVQGFRCLRCGELFF